jgi:hypothetical protein
MKLDTEAMGSLVEGLPTKSAKIRALAKAGFERADIARFLDIRYQHFRNVLTQQPPARLVSPPGGAAGGSDPPQGRSAEPAEGPTRENISLTADGSLIVPPHLLAAAGILPGDVVLARVMDGEIRLSGYAASLKRAQWLAKTFLKPGVSEVDEFIAERRAAGARGE